MDDAGDHPRAPERGPTSHRREGKAQIVMPPGSFGEEAWDNPNELLFALMGGLLGVVGGRTVLLGAGPVWQRVLGVLAVLAGLLLWFSFFLRYQPALVEGERWTRTRPRRALRAALIHAWKGFFGAALFAWLIGLFF